MNKMLAKSTTNASSAIWCPHWPESQKRRRRIGIADRKVFARPESFCTYNIVPENKSKHGISFWIVWKVS